MQQRANAARLVSIFRFEGMIETLIDNILVRYGFFTTGGEVSGQDIENLPCAFALLKLDHDKVRVALDARQKLKPWTDEESEVVKLVRARLTTINPANN